MEKLIAAPSEPRPPIDQFGATGFIVNGRTIHYDESLQEAMVPSLFISKGMESGKLFLRWVVNGFLASAPDSHQLVNQQGTVWDGAEGWWRKA